MDANQFRESVISAIKYMAFFKRHACTFSKPIEVEYGFNGEKRKVIPTICFVEVPDEELDEEIDALSTTPLVKTKLTRGLRAKSGVIDDSIGSAVENGMPAIDTAKINDLPSKETYVSGLRVPSYDFREWSYPIYHCPENGCDGGMCKNLKSVCAYLPPKYEYKCNKCGHTDYLPQ